jgi:hypothetical protein
MSGPTAHPDLVPFVAGTGKDTGGDQAIARHLEECDACRREVAQLQGLRRSLRAAAAREAVSAGGHLEIEALVEHEAKVADPAGNDADGSADTNQFATAHLAVCPECRADLESLLRARRALGTDRFVSSSVRRRWRLPAAVAAAALVLAGGAMWFHGTPGPRRIPATPAPGGFTFLPPHRGETGEPRLLAGRRVALRIALPFGSPPGAYEVRVESPDGAASSPIAVSVIEPGVVLGATLETPPQAGSYRIVVRPLDDERTAPIVYPFAVVAADSSDTAE